jgi:hypothetical protein
LYLLIFSNSDFEILSYTNVSESKCDYKRKKKLVNADSEKNYKTPSSIVPARDFRACARSSRAPGFGFSAFFEMQHPWLDLEQEVDIGGVL